MVQLEKKSSFICPSLLVHWCSPSITDLCLSAYFKFVGCISGSIQRKATYLQL